MSTTVGDVHFGSETVKGTLARLAMALVGFAGTIIFARILGPAGFGGFYLLFALAKIIDRPVGGSAIAAKKRYSEPEAPKREITGGIIAVIVVWMVAVIPLTYLASDWLTAYTGLEDAWILTAILVIPVAFYTAIDELVESIGLLGVANWIDALRSFITFPAQLLFIFFGLGAAGMVFGLAGATLLTLPVLWTYLGLLPTLPSKETLQSLWSFARYSIPASFVTQTYDRMDLLLLGIILYPSVAGQYEVAIKLTLPGIFVATVASGGLLGRVSHQADNLSGIKNDVTNTLSFSSIFSIPIFFGALAIPQELVVTVYGGEYRASAALLIGLAAFRIVQTQRIPLRETLDGLNLPERGFKLSIITLSFNVLAGVYLILQFGAIGAVIATVAAELIYYAGAAHFVRMELPQVSLHPRPLLKQGFSGGIMFAVVFLLNEIIIVRSWIDLGILVTLGALVYWLVLLAISDELRVVIGRVLRDSRIEHLVPKQILGW